ncbi:MAG: hypothetical protein ACI3ZD_11220 [Prevotella sp.]
MPIDSPESALPFIKRKDVGYYTSPILDRQALALPCKQEQAT